MGPRVEITQQMRDQAYEFAVAIETKKNQYPRFNQEMNELIETTYIGKLGELAFLRYLNSLDIYPDVSDMFTIFEGVDNVDNYDFITPDGHTVDVKAGYLSKHKRLMVNTSQFTNRPKDGYVGVKLYTNKQAPNIAGITSKDEWVYAIIQGWATRQEIANVESKFWGKDYANAVLYDGLRDIDELIKYF